MKNKKGQMVAVIMVIAVLLLVAMVGFAIYKFSPTKQEVSPNQPAPQPNPSNPASGNTACGGLQPSVASSTMTDLYNPGTSIGGLTTYYFKNSQYMGTSAPTVARGDKVKALVDNSTVIGAVKEITVDCGTNAIDTSGKTYANATITVYSTAGNNVLTNSATGGAQNETAGAVQNWKIHMVGNDKKTTGRQLLIVELTSTTNISSLSLSGATQVGVPDGYTRQLNNAYLGAFELPALDGNSVADYNLAPVVNSGKTISGAVYLTFKAEQPFVDSAFGQIVDGSTTLTDVNHPNGKFVSGAYDSANTDKSQDTQTYNFLVK